MTLSPTPFEKFDHDCQGGDPAPALAHLADYLDQQKRFHELFEVRKLQLRQQLQLPIEKWQAIDELPDDKAEALEKGLLEICREIGIRFLNEGDVASGWQYLEPVGDRQAVARLLRSIEVTDENVESLIQVSVGEGIEAELGFGLVLERFGTCSSITTYESQLAMQPLAVRRGPAKMLVNHLYRELCERVSACIEEQEGAAPSSDRLAGLIEGRDWLFEGLGHHIDTTHLASTVRISKILVDETAIQNARELAEYGSKLHEDFQYPGQTPFEDIYPDTLEFLNALSGHEVEKAVVRLQEVERNRRESGNLDAGVWLVYLLDQVGQGEAAIEAYLQGVHRQQAEAMITEDVCPNLMYLVARYGLFEQALDFLASQGDLLAYATVKSIEMQQS